MKAATIIIAIILLLPASQQRPAGVERKVLWHNPTYGLWFFWPSGEDADVPEHVKEVHKTGSHACFTDVWIICESGKPI